MKMKSNSKFGVVFTSLPVPQFYWWWS